MTPQQLKNSILQLAIQGKLVEQRPEEGTGEELYQQIQAEKQRLIKAGKLKKEKPLPEIKEDEIPFEIPEGWKWVRFGDLISLLSGQDLPPSEYNDLEDGVPYITGASNIDNGELSINRWTNKPKNIAVKDDLLLTCKGTVGKTTILKEPEVHIARQLMAIRTINIDTSYAKWFIESQIVNLKSKAKSMIPGIDRNNVLLLLFPLPSFAEQNRIVARIEELLPLVDAYEQAWTQLEALNKRFPEDLQKAILQQAIQGKLVEQRAEEGTAEELYKQIQAEKQKLIKDGQIKKEKNLPPITEEETPFEIPEGWKWVNLGDVLSVRGGKRIPAGRKLSDLDTGHKYIRVTDMKNGSVSLDNIKYVPDDIFKKIKAYTISKEDVYITVAGTIGRVGLIPDELHNANLTENANKLLVYTNSKEYVYYLLCSPLVQNQINDATTKVGQPKLAIMRLENFMLPLSPLKEQNRIVARIEELLPLSEILKKQTEKQP